MDADQQQIARKTFYIGDYEPIDVLKFATNIAREFNVTQPKSVPLWLLKIAGLVGDGLNSMGVGFPLTTFRLNNLVTPMLHDFTVLKAVVSDLLYSMSDGVRLTVNWMREHEQL